ncbi:MAG: serine/threonine-protein kinase [Planctomycetota bacterium]
MLVTLATAACARAPRAAGRYQAWAEALGSIRADPSPARVSELLATIPEDQRADALVDLLSEALQIAWRRAPAPPLAAWLDAIAPGFEPPADLVEAEFVARHQPPHGDAPAPADSSRLLAEGRFILLRRLGRGAMGEVWEARDTAAGRLVAIKRSIDMGMGDRLECEREVTAALDHPAVLSIREIGRDPQGRPFAVMPLASGPNFDESIAGLHRIAGDPRTLLAPFLAACDAVAHAHSRGVLHRDLKPAHIVPGAGVLDWGVARRASAPDGLVAGTPEYMAPEQADGRADERSDVFALGGVLFHILTGRPPRAWPDAVRPASWAEFVRSVPLTVPGGSHAALRRVCRQAMNPDPRERFLSAGAFADRLRRSSDAAPSFWRHVLAWVQAPACS